MLVFFIPSLGMLNCLRHYQSEKIPFGSENFYGGQKYDFKRDKLYFGNAPVVAWADITHVDYSNPDNPKPPPYKIYTGLTSKEFFIIFLTMWFLQIFFIWLHNFLRSPAFKSLSAFDQIMHSFQSVITPAPSVDWVYGQGDCEDHFKRMKDVEKEVIGVIKINSIFNILHILPITYLGNYLLLHSQYLNNVRIMSFRQGIK